MAPRRLHIVSTALVPLLSCVDGKLAWQQQLSLIFERAGSSAAFSKPRRHHLDRQPGPRRRSCGGSIFLRKQLEGCHWYSSKGRSWGTNSVYMPLRESPSGGPSTERLVSPTTQEGRLTIEQARGVLRTLFGHDDFRDGQVSQ